MLEILDLVLVLALKKFLFLLRDFAVCLSVELYFGDEKQLVVAADAGEVCRDTHSTRRRISSGINSR